MTPAADCQARDAHHCLPRAAGSLLAFHIESEGKRFVVPASGAVIGRKTYGTFPVLQVNGPDDTSTGRWIPTTSVDEYSATMAKWFGVDAAHLPVVFPNLGRFENPDLGFMRE